MPLRPVPKPKKRAPAGARKEWLREAYRLLVRPAYLAGLAAGQRRRKPLCERCLSAVASELHHRAGRSGGRLLAFDTYAGLCRACHAFVHANPERSYAEGWLLRSLQGVEHGEDAAAEQAAAEAEEGDEGVG